MYQTGVMGKWQQIGVYIEWHLINDQSCGDTE